MSHTIPLSTGTRFPAQNGTAKRIPFLACYLKELLRKSPVLNFSLAKRGRTHGG